MSRTKYWLFLTVLPIIIGLVSRDIAQHSWHNAQMFQWQAMVFVILIYIPVISIWRMLHLNFTWKEILLSLIPFVGVKYRNRRLFDPK